MNETEVGGFTLPRIYPITDMRLTGLSHCEQVRRLAAGGATLVQLREKHLSPRDFYEEALEATRFAHSNGVRLIINDRVDVALAVKADGVHLGQTDLPPASARKLLGAEAIIGFSTHSKTQALAALNSEVDYVAIGPVFPTGTKENPDEIVGLDGVTAVREVVGSLPTVAIGGISEKSIADVLRAGADSLAIISAILTFDGGLEAGYRHFQELASGV